MLQRPRPWFLLLALWGAALCVISHQSSLHPPGPDFRHVDKLEHAAYFTLGGLLFFLGLRAARPGMGCGSAAVFTVLFCSAVGALDEFHQSFIPNRSGNDWGDWLADTAGGLFGTLIGQRLQRRKPEPKASCES